MAPTVVPVTPTEPLLRIERLSAGFESSVVFRSLSFDIPARGITAVMGPAGVGKSTLLRTLGRWNEPHPSFWSHGRVWFHGRDILRDIDVDEARRQVALLAQKARLFTASVLENAIAIIAEGRQTSFAEKRELAREVLEPWGLWEELSTHLDAPVTTLSLARQRMLSLARLMSGGAECILADEPLRDITHDEKMAVADLFARLARTRSVVIVTHDQREAQKLADSVCLISAGQLIEHTPAREFFSDPRTELGRAFLRSGNCWPRGESGAWKEGGEAVAPRLQVEPSARRPSWLPTPEESTQRPGGFHWVIAGKLGGMQWPGLLSDESTDLNGLAALGVQQLVSLTEEPFDSRKLSAFGIQSVHFPIPDMGVPLRDAAAALCVRICTWIDAGRPTVVHCKAGLGRTGTLLACVLVARGFDSVRAIHHVRQVNPRYIQSEAQLKFVGEFRL